MKKYRTPQEIAQEHGHTLMQLGAAHYQLEVGIPKDITRLRTKVYELEQEHQSAVNRSKNVKIVKEDTHGLITPEGQPLTSPEGPQTA